MAPKKNAKKSSKAPSGRGPGRPRKKPLPLPVNAPETVAEAAEEALPEAVQPSASSIIAELQPSESSTRSSTALPSPSPEDSSQPLPRSPDKILAEADNILSLSFDAHDREEPKPSDYYLDGSPYHSREASPAHSMRSDPGVKSISEAKSVPEVKSVSEIAEISHHNSPEMAKAPKGPSKTPIKVTATLTVGPRTLSPRKTRSQRGTSSPTTAPVASSSTSTPAVSKNSPAIPVHTSIPKDTIRVRSPVETNHSAIPTTNHPPVATRSVKKRKTPPSSPAQKRRSRNVLPAPMPPPLEEEDEEEAQNQPTTGTPSEGAAGSSFSAPREFGPIANGRRLQQTATTRRSATAARTGVPEAPSMATPIAKKTSSSVSQGTIPVPSLGTALHESTLPNLPAPLSTPKASAEPMPTSSTPTPINTPVQFPISTAPISQNASGGVSTVSVPSSTPTLRRSSRARGVRATSPPPPTPQPLRSTRKRKEPSAPAVPEERTQTRSTSRNVRVKAGGKSLSGAREASTRTASEEE
ncbi:hypothetical protein FN846DRAFT_380003 [Sphaerosporella brunnea]|uniref:Uncharacterized protein n=1 Tax=Sphaerosporella brunnea TaxID=1250544 RepID=A0A5J5F5W7_9PEZI|nr:hypothetical protein FN846DRAFT_380003 [Sphaerosporella brunnea]